MNWLVNIQDFLSDHVFQWFVYYQCIALLSGGVLGYAISKFTFPKKRTSFYKLRFPVLSLLIFFGVWAEFERIEYETFVIQSTTLVLAAWIATKMIRDYVAEDFWNQLVSRTIWSIVILHITGFLHPIIEILESFEFKIGAVDLTPFIVIKGVLALVTLLWGAISLSKFLEQRVYRSNLLEPSLQVLFAKLTKISFIVIAVFWGFSIIGIDMSIFAVFGGAIGVGIGFGLQKIVSNLICGVILLMDRSIRPGAVIALDGGKQYGVVNRLSARCVSIRTRDGKEHLVPNEDFVVNKVENWSYSDSLLRIHVPLRVKLGSDLKLVEELILKATEGVPRVLLDPKPKVRFFGFTANVVEIELRFWISDPENGRNGARSPVLLNIWSLFEENGIEIPIPAREVYFS